MGTALILIALAVGFSVWSGAVFESKTDYFEDEMNKLILLAENSGEKLGEETESVVSQWRESSALLRCVAAHDGIDELERIITSLPELLECSDKEEFKIRCIEAKNLIKNLKSCEKIRLENVL